MKFFSLGKTSNVRSSSSWAWPSCNQLKTLSFRVTAGGSNDAVSKAVNSEAETVESFFTESPNSASFSTLSEISRGGDPTETVIRGLRSDRLFFEPDETSSIMEAKLTGVVPFKNSVVLWMDSKDPYVDFRNSMEEIVHTLGVTDWDSLEELLCWYLKLNEKHNHKYIVAAFVDFLFDLAFANSRLSSEQQKPYPRPSFSPSSSSSSSSSCTTPCVYCFQHKVEKKEEEEGAVSVSASSFSVKDEITPEDEASCSSSKN